MYFRLQLRAFSILVFVQELRYQCTVSLNGVIVLGIAGKRGTRTNTQIGVVPTLLPGFWLAFTATISAHVTS